MAAASGARAGSGSGSGSGRESAGRRASAGSRSTSRARSSAPVAAIPQLGWREARAAPVVLISGPQDFLADRAARRIRDQGKAADADLEVSDIAAADYVAGELLTLASPSLFGEPRLIRVSSAEKGTDQFYAEMLDYLGAPHPDTTVVIRHSGGQRGKKLLDAIRGGSGGGIEIVCSELKRDSDLHDFAAAEFREARRRVTPGALRALVSAFMSDVGELAAACTQVLSDTVGDVTEEVVARYYGGRVETTAFVVADSAIQGRSGEALAGLRQAIASGADPVPIVAAFASKLRTMAKVSGVRGNSAQLASTLGLAPWQIDRARRDLAGWTDDGLGACIELLARTDEDVKGAARDPVYALERMVTMIGSRGSRGTVG